MADDSLFLNTSLTGTGRSESGLNRGGGGGNGMPYSNDNPGLSTVETKKTSEQTAGERGGGCRIVGMRLIRTRIGIDVRAIMT